jgi:hypothetical protein
MCILSAHLLSEIGIMTTLYIQCYPLTGRHDPIFRSFSYAWQQTIAGRDQRSRLSGA